MKITLQLIADKANVSRSLVSKIINNKPVRVSPQKRAQIVRLAQQFNYMPRGFDSGGRLPVIRKKKVTGIIQPDLNFNFLTQLTNELDSRLRQHDISPLIFNSHEDPLLEREFLELCLAGLVDGLIINACDNYENLEYFKKIKDAGIPMVFVDRYVFDLDASYVTSDNKHGAYRLAKELISKGHKNILFIFHGKSICTSAQINRFSGYQQAMEEAGLEVYKEYLYPDRPLHYQPIYNMNDFMKFSAVILATTWDLQFICEIFNKAGADLNIDIGAFDSFTIPFPYSTNRSPYRCIRSLTLMLQHPEAIAEKTVEILVSQMNTKKADTRQILIGCDMLTIDTPQMP